MNESAANQQQQHHCICEDISNLLRNLGPSESVVEHFRNARVEILKGFRQMIDDKISRAQGGTPKGTSFGVE
jgi:hypothetical protein